MGEISNFIIITVLIFLSVLLDFFQEHKAEKAADSLRHSVSKQTTVIRDSNNISLPVSQIVPGDVVLLSAGDMVPADVRLLDASDLIEASNAVFMGTNVISGNAKVLIVNTGLNTAMGAIADNLTKAPPQTSFEIGTEKFGTLTEAKIKSEKHVNPNGEKSLRVLELAYLKSFRINQSF
ncbi:hypothetical protein ND861_13185 [Leptospira sp. 2 VSF19]|uniref:P-type ATPase A domain-containing protein n=1 Tax=Leptospira soteropolitanensis TaxID=2950025 RepID=A0AAW5VLJ3_9LEPT|nr:hypothetical protein [Leptospira soteropolitanensis]MCW7493597.1 hypothetical protein [Leptospira soteropolitanensis]MCW7501196.1 hypothetical protein [Leptospira soteropolitanensis]MCW7523618.1 hypothetical protein [Leptospira soteropolitanensis]MCW7527309.1 hypothetical protein [Leptospira soteropolitanensis]MCW7531166.1 hypothetical protein [Leptospira soteropolitanensis]